MFIKKIFISSSTYAIIIFMTASQFGKKVGIFVSIAFLDEKDNIRRQSCDKSQRTGDFGKFRACMQPAINGYLYYYSGLSGQIHVFHKKYPHEDLLLSSQRIVESYNFSGGSKKMIENMGKLRYNIVVLILSGL